MNKKELLEDLKNKGFSEDIINAFKKVHREKFIPKNLNKYAYENTSLYLAEGSTLSQPFTIAFILNLLEIKGEENILEIGSGSGYLLALLSELTQGKIYGIEIIKYLADKSRKLLQKHKRITVLNQNGSNGLQNKAPFDRIILSAAADKIPIHLYSQLNNHGILVTPVKNSIFQIKKENEIFIKREFPGFVFVPLEQDF